MTMWPTFTTARFAIPPAQFAKLMMGRVVGRLWWTLAFPAAALMAAAITANMAYAFLALILLFIIYPLALTMVYFNYALTPNAPLLVYPHTVTLDDNRLTITTFPVDEEGRALPGKTVAVPVGHIAAIDDTGRWLIIHLAKGDQAWPRIVPVPATALQDFVDRQE